MSREMGSRVPSSVIGVGPTTSCRLENGGALAFGLAGPMGEGMPARTALSWSTSRSAKMSAPAPFHFGGNRLFASGAGVPGDHVWGARPLSVLTTP